MGRPVMIDLFSGAGGLTLGLEAAGFQSALAVESSEMAAETYYRNFIQDDESAWHRHLSLVPDDQIAAGVAVQRTSTVLGRLAAVMARLEAFGGDLDLLAGGPPCQGFSLAGLRNPDDQRNRLPFEFLRFVGELRPKLVLIENVAGIGMSFGKEPGQAPLEQLRDALRVSGEQGYLAQILEVNARDFGVAQNRPRLMIVGLRLDLAGRLRPELSRTELHTELSTDRWARGRFAGPPPLLAPAAFVLPEAPSVGDAIGDLVQGTYRFTTSDQYPDDSFARSLRFPDYQVPATASRQSSKFPPNHIPRRHGSRVELRFKLHIALAPYGVQGSIFGLGARAGYDLHAAMDAVSTVLEAHGVHAPIRMPDGSPILDPVSGEDVGSTVRALRDTILELTTRKHSQRALVADRPSPTVLSLPDDFVHYAEPRTLTVREMARIQSFPDTFVFYSKETTGAERRRVEVPQYTQVANAVPPLLARAVGMHLRTVLAQTQALSDVAQVQQELVLFGR